MQNRWGVLAALFLIRFTMAFQFQSVAAVAPLLTRDFGLGLAEIGFLIGLYFTPGVVLALPAGAIGQRLGDRRSVLAALALMLLGSVAMAATFAWHWQVAGRFVAGAGAVLLSVQLTKMITDWFAGREISTAMAILVNSWPAGVALSLLTLPSIATGHGIAAVHLAVAVLIAVAVLPALVYRPPPGAAAAKSTGPAPRIDAKTVLAVVAAGLMYGLYNVGFAMIFSFGPSLLVERGWSIAGAGSAISIVLWLAVISVPAGGVLADRLRRPQAVLVGGCVLFAALMLGFAHFGAVIPFVVALGLISGQAAGPMMSLPARVLEPATRAIGMGGFYTLHYGAMMLGAMIGGALAKSSGSAAGRSISAPP